MRESKISYKNLAQLALPLFIFWPFGAFLLSLFDIKRKTSLIVYVLFSALYGFSFTFENVSADSYRLAMVFSNHFNYSNLKEVINVFLIGGFTDLYLKFSYGVIKQFTTNPKILFAFFGLIFGYFSYSSLLLLVKEKKIRNNLQLVIISLTFFSLYPLSTMNGVRFNTAALVFFVSVINIIVYNKKRWVVGLIICALIHFSYIIVIPIVLFILWIVRLLKNKRKIPEWFFYLFYISFIISFVLNVNIIPLKSIVNFDIFPSSIAYKFNSYTSDKLTNIINLRSESLFHTVNRIFNNGIKIYILIFVYYLKLKINYFKIEFKYYKLLKFTLLFLSFGAIAQSIPSGGRFLVNGFMIFFYLFYQLYLNNRILINKKFIQALPILFSFQILFVICYFSYTNVSLTLWYGNLVWIIKEGLSFQIYF